MHQLDEYAADVLDRLVRCLEGGLIEPAGPPVVGPLHEQGLLRFHLVVRDLDHHVVLLLLLGESYPLADFGDDVKLVSNPHFGSSHDILLLYSSPNAHRFVGRAARYLHEDAAFPRRCNLRVLVHLIRIRPSVSHMCTIDVFPEDLAIAFGGADEVVDVEDEGAHNLVHGGVLIHYFHDDTTGHDRESHRELFDRECYTM